MPQPTAANRVAYWTAVGLIWSLAAWHAWEARALFGDGANFFIHAVQLDRFVHFYPARDYAMLASQVPLLAALKLGVDDLAWLARIFGIGVFGLPTAFYHLALARARRDTVLLAIVIAAIALVFMPTSFCAVGEYNAAFAVALASAAWLATTDRARLLDGFIIVAMAAFALRVYEAFVYLGPPLAAMALNMARSPAPRQRTSVLPFLAAAAVAVIAALVGRYAVLVGLVPLLAGLAVVAWQRPQTRQAIAAALHLIAAALFVAGAATALRSLVGFVSPDRLEVTPLEIFDVWTNPPFILGLGAAATVAVWALLRPADLATGRPYRWAGVWLVLLALFPALALAVSDTEIRPLAFGQCSSRVAGGPLALVFIVLIWLCPPSSHGPAWLAPIQAALRAPGAARRLLVFAGLTLLATLPTDAFLTRAWSDYLFALRMDVRTHAGIFTTDRAAAAAWPHVLMIEPAMLTCQGLIVRSRPGDGVIMPIGNDADWVACSPGDAAAFGRFFWHEN